MHTCHVTEAVSPILTRNIWHGQQLYQKAMYILRYSRARVHGIFPVRSPADNWRSHNIIQGETNEECTTGATSARPQVTELLLHLAYIRAIPLSNPVLVLGWLPVRFRHRSKRGAFGEGMPDRRAPPFWSLLLKG